MFTWFLFIQLFGSNTLIEKRLRVLQIKFLDQLNYIQINQLQNILEFG